MMSRDATLHERFVWTQYPNASDNRSHSVTIPPPTTTILSATRRMTVLSLRPLVASVVTACATLGTAAHAATESVTIYSSRIEQLIKPILDQYTKETGVEIRM